MTTKDALTWFEIPAADLARATQFYEAVLQRPLRHEVMGPMAMAVFDYAEPGVGGCLASGPGLTPGAQGGVVYLNAAPSIDAALARVPAAGGKVVVPKTPLPGAMGAFARIIDCEGNLVGLHAA
jgi:predicted enzyme related to lactoylglutathione lyase